MRNESILHKRYLDPLRGTGPYTIDTQENGQQKNIIFISVDMVPMEFHHTVTGGFPIETPNIDSLSKDGVNFQNAFCTSPLCTPSRASYLTGRYSYITGNGDCSHDGQEGHIRENDIMWGEYLKSEGYHMRHVGKSHVGTHKMMDLFTENDSPWDRWSPPWFDDDQYLTYLTDLGLTPLEFAKPLYGVSADGTKNGNFYGGYIAPQHGKPFPEDGTYPAFLVHKAIQALKTQNNDKPSFLQLDFFGPHQPFAIPGGMEERAEELRETLTLPESFLSLMKNEYAAPSGEPRIYRLYRKNWGLTDAEIVREYRIVNILQYELIDEMIGKLISHLKESGIYDNTWIYFIADHGEMNCEMGLIDKGTYLNPRVIRVPMVVKPPVSRQQTWKPGALVKGIVSLLDIAPTILYESGIEIPERLDGLRLHSALSGDERPEEYSLMCEIWNHTMPNLAVGTIFKSKFGGYRFFSYNMTDDRDELYEINDAADLCNLLSGMSLIQDNAEGSSDPVIEAHNEAVRVLEKRLDRDARWFQYARYLRLEYAHIVGMDEDNQLFWNP